MPSWTYFTHYGSASSPVGRYGEPRKKRSRPIRTKAEHAPINQRQRCSPTRKPGHATHRASAFACRYWSVPVQAAAFIESRRLWQSARDATPKETQEVRYERLDPFRLAPRFRNVLGKLRHPRRRASGRVHPSVRRADDRDGTRRSDRVRPPKPRPPSNRPVCNGPVDPSRRNLRTAALLAGSPVPGQSRLSRAYSGTSPPSYARLVQAGRVRPREQADPPPLFRRYRRYGRAGKFPHGDVQHRQRTGGTQRSAHRPFRPFPTCSISAARPGPMPSTSAAATPA